MDIIALREITEGLQALLEIETDVEVRDVISA